MTRRLIISDTHFGSGDELLHHPRALERIEPELDWAQEVVINGDLFELVFAPLTEAVERARPLLTLIARHVNVVRFLPGNHDHHLVSLASDERRFDDVLGIAGDTRPVDDHVLGYGDRQPFRVRPAEKLLRELMPGVEVITGYPLIELDGLYVTHGHYISPHVESFGWRLFDRLAWQLTGLQKRPEQLCVADYEALVGPIYELLYEMANLPQGPRAQEIIERWLVGVGAWMQAPVKASRQVAGFAAGMARRSRGGNGVPLNPSMPSEQAVQAMSAVCVNLDVPAGRVLFGHTHSPIAGEPSRDGRWEFWNSGSWCFDRRLRHHPSYRETCWPGTVLRAEGDEVSLHSLLADLGDSELLSMLPDGAPRPKPKLGRAVVGAHLRRRAVAMRRRPVSLQT